MRSTFLAAPIALLLLLGLGCKNNQQAADATHFYYVDADDAKAAEKGQAFEDPTKVSPANKVTKADLDSLAKTRATAEAAMKASPTAETKKTFLAVTDDLADKTMDCGDLTPKEKYPAALRLYREALKVDPKDPRAKEAADTIVAIYHQMGRPVPN